MNTFMFVWVLSLCCRYIDGFVNKCSSVLPFSFVYKAIRKIGSFTRGHMNVTSPIVHRNVTKMLHLPTCASALFKEYGLIFFIRVFLPTQKHTKYKTAILLRSLIIWLFLHLPFFHFYIYPASPFFWFFFLPVFVPLFISSIHFPFPFSYSIPPVSLGLFLLNYAAPCSIVSVNNIKICILMNLSAILYESFDWEVVQL